MNQIIKQNRLAIAVLTFNVGCLTKKWCRRLPPPNIYLLKTILLNSLAAVALSFALRLFVIEDK